MATKPEFDYRKIKLEDMVHYVIDNEKKDRIDLTAFYDETPKYKMVDEYNADGKPKTYVGKDGKVKIKKKKEKIAGEKTTKYNFLKAKRALYKEFKNDISWINPPLEKAEKEKKKASSILELLK